MGGMLVAVIASLYIFKDLFLQINGVDFKLQIPFGMALE